MSKKANKGLEMPQFKVVTQDERIPIEYIVKNSIDGDIVKTLYFNPNDKGIYQHIFALENIKEENITDFNEDNENEVSEAIKRFSSLSEKIDYHFDSIFGDGAAKFVFKYSGIEQQGIKELLETVRQAMDWFNEVAKTKANLEEMENRKAKAEQVKAEKQAFLANK